MRDNNLNASRKKIGICIVIALLFLLDTCFFDTKFGEFFIEVNNPHNKFLIIIITLIIFMLCALKGKMKFSAKNEIDKFFLFYQVAVIITFIGSVFVYNQPIIAVLRNYYYYLFLFFYYPLKYLLNKYDWLGEKIIDYFILFGTIYTVILIISKIYYMLNGLFFLSSELLEVTIRNKSLRLLHVSGIIAPSCIFSCYRFIKYKEKKYLISLLCTFIGLFWVNQTRVTILAVIASIVAILYVYNKNRRLLVIGIMIITMLVFNQKVSNFIDSFSIDNNDTILSYSTSIRLEAYSYFLGKTFYNRIFGIGFINDASYNSLKYGPKGKYVIADVGYIGIIGVFGILGIILLFLFFKILIKFLIYAYKNSTQDMNLLLLGLVVFYIISCASMCFNDMQRMLYLPIYFALINFANHPKKSEQEE